MSLSSWDLAASFLVGVAAASVAWGVWGWLHRSPGAPALPPTSSPAVARTPGSGRSSAADPPPVARRGHAAPGALRTSQRVILHLSRQPRLGYGDVAPREITQSGMTDALGVPQPALTKVLARLVDGGALLTTRTHVSGAPRRLKVYQLTAHGEAIARDLRRRAAVTAEARLTAVDAPRPAAVSEVRSADARPSAET